MSDTLQNVLADIDRFNRQDPKGYEFPYSERLTAWVLRLNPQPSEALRIAARGQHIGRWKSPRETYPMDRGGYLRWREDLKRFHADTVGEIMKRHGCAPGLVERVRQIILKKNLAADADVQTLEDGLCLVFLETQFDDLRGKTPDEKMKDIIRKTWKKMSSNAREIALGLPLTAEQRAFLQSALQP